MHLTAALEAIEDYENMDRDAAITHLDQATALASGEAAEFYKDSSPPPTHPAEAMSSQLRPSRYLIPGRPPDLLRRPRLLNFLHEHIHRKLVLIAAAAGYGKSSLLADFLNDVDFRVAWCLLDENDADLAALAGDLAAALRRCFPAFQSALPALAAQPGAAPEALAAALAREIETSLDEHFILALDDFHLAQASPPVLRFFDSLTTILPEQAHLLLAGRALPPLESITRLAAHNQIAGLSEEHLRFTAAEVQELLALRNRLSLPEREAEELVAHTEGWITGILLTSHLMWQGLMASLMRARQSESPLYDYLAAEVLTQQPEPLRRFLLESAVLPEMEPAMCNAVLGRTDSAHLLDEAEARRLFVSAVGDEVRTYQYHHLFRDFLLARLRLEDAPRLTVLQGRAAEWYAANGMVEAAVTFYALAGQLARAAQVAEANAEAALKAGRHETLRRWAEQLAAVALDCPRLHLFLAAAENDVGRQGMAEEALDIASAGFSRADDPAGGVDADILRSLLAYRRGEFERALRLAQAAIPRARELGRPASAAVAFRYVGLCLFALGRLAEAEEAFHQAAALLQTAPHRYDLAWTLHDLALVLRARGRTAAAAQAQQGALEIWREHVAPGPLALGLNNTGWDLYMLGQNETALTTYAEALDWARRSGSTRLEATILAGQADVLADLGNTPTAASLYQQAMDKLEDASDWALAAYLRRGMARLDRRARNYVGALEWLRRAGLIAGEGRAETLLANIESLRGIILVEMGHVRDGHEVLKRVCTDLEQSGALVDLAQALLFRACAERRDADPESALSSLTRALEIAERVGYDQMLVGEALSCRDLLEAFQNHATLGPRAAGLLARAEARSAPPQMRIEAPAAAPSSNDFRVCALGAGLVMKNGAEIPRSAWGTPKARELFFFLVDRAPIHRDKVLDVFWSGKSAARALNNLYQLIFRLRRAFGYHAILLEDQECRLAPELCLNYDVARFEIAAAAALAPAAGDLRRLDSLAAALDLYAGEYLADLPADWTLQRRQALSSLHVSLLAAYADELMRLTRYADARDALTRALAVEPLRDDLHQRMLVCLAGLGRRHEVVDHYRRYRETLRWELGLDPPAELRALYGRLIE